MIDFQRFTNKTYYPNLSSEAANLVEEGEVTRFEVEEVVENKLFQFGETLSFQYGLTLQSAEMDRAREMIAEADGDLGVAATRFYEDRMDNPPTRRTM